AEQCRQPARDHGDPEHRAVRGAVAGRDAEIRARDGDRDRPRGLCPRPDRPRSRRRYRFRPDREEEDRRAELIDLPLYWVLLLTWYSVGRQPGGPLAIISAPGKRRWSMFFPSGHGVTLSASRQRLERLIEERARPNANKDAIDRRIWNLLGAK